MNKIHKITRYIVAQLSRPWPTYLLTELEIPGFVRSKVPQFTAVWCQMTLNNASHPTQKLTTMILF